VPEENENVANLSSSPNRTIKGATPEKPIEPKSASEPKTVYQVDTVHKHETPKPADQAHVNELETPVLVPEQETPELAGKVPSPALTQESPQEPVSQDPFRCTISWVSSIDEIYLLPSSKLEEFHDILVSVQDHGSSVVDLEVGNMCLSSLEDIMYRARIERVSSDKKKVKVFFVDIGRKETVPAADLKQLLHHLESPGVVVRAGLAGVKPADGVSWNKESIDTFKLLVDAEGDMEFVVTPVKG